MLEMLGSAWDVFLIIFVFSILVFVHELGHFLAALAVGVRPERFFIGFDIFGLGIKKEFRGCVYGIGLLPLGGYVKLAGQSDDPREQAIGHGKPDEIGSKPLWAQGTIIVAGVVMNMIFGYLLLVYGYSVGLPQIPPVAGTIAENTPAYMAGIRTGDRILSVDGKPLESLNYLKEYTVLNTTGFFQIKLEREGKTIERQVKGYSGGQGFNELGIKGPLSTIVGDVNPKMPDGAGISGIIKDGDKFISVNNIPLPDNQAAGDFMMEIIEKNPGREIEAVIEREGKTKKVMLPVTGQGVYDIGFSVKIKVDKVSDGSPALKAGLRDGDWITAVILDGERRTLLDSAMLSRYIRSRTYLPVKLSVLREGKLIENLEIETRFMGGNMAIPAGKDTLLGLTGENTPDGFRVDTLIEESPATGILKTGDIIKTVNGKPFKDLQLAVADASCREIGIERGGGEKPLMIKPSLNPENGVARIGISMGGFPEVITVNAGTPAAKYLKPGDIVGDITVSSGGAKETSLRWLSDDGKVGHAKFATPDDARELILAGKSTDISGNIPAIIFYNSIGARKAGNIGSAMTMAFDKSIDMSLTVYKMLHRLVTKQIDSTNMSGPIGIFRIMKTTAEGEDPFIRLLFLMALISINLAIFNLLPFPVLDGGHLLFIIVEAIKGSPPGDKFKEISQYFGVIILLGLMLYVTYNDIGRWLRDSSTSSRLEKLHEIDE